MDVKSLARSKRAHTQHHNKKPHHKLKAPPASPSPSPSPSTSLSNDAVSKKQPNEKTATSRSSKSSALPNNWDRYEEEEPDSVSPLEGAIKAPDDVVLPKSKGADFRYLVDEARSQADSSLEGVPSVDDILPGDFNMGLGSMLAVRGEGILSWVGDDNFVVEEKTGGNQEASFLSLNLHALAENLAKVDLSKRLFIEPDLLPWELCAEGLTAGSNEDDDKLKTTEDSEIANRMSKELNLDDLAADQFPSSSPSGSSHAASTMSDDFLIPVNHVDVNFQQMGSSDNNKTFLPSAEANLHTTEDTRRKHSTFKAAAAEEELDMLLDSISETKILDSQDYKSNTSFPVPLGVSSVDPSQISNKEPVSSKTVSIAASLDDALDELLEETSTLTNPNVLSRPKEEKSVPQSIQSSSHSGSKAKVSDDFDSWFDTL